MKLKERVFVIKDHVWEDEISVVFTDNVVESVRHQVEYNNLPDYYLIDNKNADAVVLDINEPNFKAKFAVFLFGVSDDIIVHECVHLCSDLLLDRGLKHTHKTDEAFAYTTQFLFKKIVEFKRRCK